MDGAGDGPHNGIENSHFRRNYVIFIDLRNPGFIFPPTAAGDRNYVGIEGFAEFVANGGVPNHPPICVVYNQHRLVAEDVIAINELIHDDEDEANQYDFNNDNMNNIVNIDNNDGINNDNVDDNAYNRNLDINNEYAEVADPYRKWEEIRWWDEFAESDTDADTDSDEET
ncbi:hypothetical protein VZT92_000408 [Zoarces viviparus]|uniref:Uncharacterized protein n=1 Tax=Zoarces viviparus TaxID=48416 RepID=A0AAW1G711_ZOAVI